jgi:hydrogenase-1 operon protein HyaE
MPDLIESLAEHPHCSVLRSSDIEAYLRNTPRAILFFTGDTRQRPEGLDVAVVVRELLDRHAGRIGLGLVDRRDETALMPRFDVVVLPALAFFRDGEVTEVVARMRDWAVYTQACERLLADGAGANA